MLEFLKRLLPVLRKLGIIRHGSASYTYRSGKDMPAAALFDNVYDEKKDLVTKEDFKTRQP